MNTQTRKVGFDRFLALRWVNMALELRLLNQSLDKSFHQYRDWLSTEISGKETARKTSTHARRLWLTDFDEHAALRQRVFDNQLAVNQEIWPLLHFGLSLNIFPLFFDVCQATGRLLRLQPICYRRDVHKRILEKYGNPSSISSATDRVFQTLIDWGMLMDQRGAISARVILVNDMKVAQWLIEALIISRAEEKIPLIDLSKSSELLGISFEDLRSVVRLSPSLRIDNTFGLEMISKLRD